MVTITSKFEYSDNECKTKLLRLEDKWDQFLNIFLINFSLYIKNPLKKNNAEITEQINME